MRGYVVILDAQSVGVDGLEFGLDLPEGPLGFFAEKPGDVGAENVTVGKPEWDIQILVLDNFVLDKGGLQPVFRVHLPELCKILQSYKVNSKTT